MNKITMNRMQWDIVKNFIENRLFNTNTFSIYSEELIARFGLTYSFYDDMRIYAKEDRVNFFFSSPNYKPYVPYMGFNITFERI